jgi:hypothetical protein
MSYNELDAKLNDVLKKEATVKQSYATGAQTYLPIKQLSKPASSAAEGFVAIFRDQLPPENRTHR